MALEKFRGRPRFSALPANLKLDIRDFFSSYKAACDQADRLLFSAGNPQLVDRATRQADVGKLLPTALYVHVEAMHHLPLLLRVYEGCARAFIGTVEGANIVKLHRDKPAVSYLTYPDFDRDPHPALVGAMHVDLSVPKARYRDYKTADNPPILHRKEEFVSQEYPSRCKFERLTQQEQRWGLHEDSAIIGTQKYWEELLREKHVCMRGHRLIRAKQPSDSGFIVGGG